MVAQRSGGPDAGRGPEASRDSSSKDLLHLEKTESPLKKRLLECTNGEQQPASRPLKRREAPAIGPTPESTVLGRIKSFLPVIDKANTKLLSDIQERGADEFNVELVAESTERYVQMDLAMGVADLHTPEAVAAAELAINGQTRGLRDTEDTTENSSSGSSDGEHSDVEKTTRTSCSKGLVEVLGSPEEGGSDSEQKGAKCRTMEPS